MTNHEPTSYDTMFLKQTLNSQLYSGEINSGYTLNITHLFLLSKEHQLRQSKAQYYTLTAPPQPRELAVPANTEYSDKKCISSTQEASKVCSF